MLVWQEEMVLMTTLHPATCRTCGDQFYAPFAWVDGLRVDERQVCGGCGGQGVLFGEDE